MNILIVFDSFFGNTEKVARDIAGSLSSGNNVRAERVGDISQENLEGVDLLVVGSPTRAFSPSELTKEFLKSIPPKGLKGVKVAAFDTRISVDDVDSKFLKFMVKMFGYAAKTISDALVKKGGVLEVPPEGFYVKGNEGPLKDGELERAASWLNKKAINKLKR
ncbi:MAG: flavodoxin family protein [Acidobacteriota bacterium]